MRQTTLFLGRRDCAPTRALLDAGTTVAFAADFNPASSPLRRSPW